MNHNISKLEELKKNFFFNSIVLSYNVNIFFVSICWANALEQNAYDFKGIFLFC